MLFLHSDSGHAHRDHEIIPSTLIKNKNNALLRIAFYIFRRGAEGDHGIIPSGPRINAKGFKLCLNPFAF
jgi:hypothetical protein